MTVCVCVCVCVSECESEGSTGLGVRGSLAAETPCTARLALCVRPSVALSLRPFPGFANMVLHTHFEFSLGLCECECECECGCGCEREWLGLALG